MNYEDRVTKEYVEGLLAGAGAKIATGSYVGTGEYGEDYPNSLTFDFAPKVLILYGYDKTDTASRRPTFSIFIYGYDRALSVNTRFSSGMLVGDAIMNEIHCVTWGSNSVTWYSTSRPLAQMNLSGVSYSYLAIG